MTTKLVQNVHNMPHDMADRPELRPLVEAGIRAGDVLFAADPARWALDRVMEGADRPTPAMLKALANLNPVPEHVLAAAIRRKRTVTP